MSHRRKIQAADIKGDPRVRGEFNAERCIAYLRGIGAEIDDATADGWIDAQAVTRFLRSEKRVKVEGWRSSCRCGEMTGFGEVRRPRRRRPKKAGEQPHRCPSCGTSWVGSSLVYVEMRDGSTRDYRPQAERWQPLSAFIAEMRQLTGGAA